VEVFRVVDGAMTVRVGDDTWDVSGQDDAEIEVPAGILHGFVNIGQRPLVVEVDLVFTPPGPRPEADLMAFWVELDKLVRSGPTSPRTGMPSLLRLAALLDQVPEAFTQPGFPGLLMKPLAVLGRLRGYRTTSSDEES
jgi:hypothetical protein